MAAQSYARKLPSHTGTSYRRLRRYVKRTTAKLARRMGKRYDDVRVEAAGWGD